MGEPKAFASLSSGLLARKGAARPAMKPQGFGQNGSGLEDLGWNDMGFEPPKPVEENDDVEKSEESGDVESHPTRTCADGLSPVGSPVHDQQADLEGKLAECSENGEEEDETAEIYEPSEEEVAALQASANSDPSMRAGTTAGEDVVESDDDYSPAPIAMQVSAPSFAPVEEAKEEAQPAPRRKPRARRAPGSKEKAAFTLRIAKDRHLKLRLACAVKGMSAQKLVTEALDAWLDAMPELDDMAENASE